MERAKQNGTYYYLTSTMLLEDTIDARTAEDNKRFLAGNYFKTEDAAAAARKRVIGALVQEVKQAKQDENGSPLQEAAARHGFKLSTAYRKQDSRGSEYGFFVVSTTEDDEVMLQKHDEQGHEMWFCRFDNVQEFERWATCNCL